MSKKDFIALADSIRYANGTKDEFSAGQLKILAQFCRSQNYNFMESRWLGYIAGENGPSGKVIKKAA